MHWQPGRRRRERTGPFVPKTLEAIIVGQFLATRHQPRVLFDRDCVCDRPMDESCLDSSALPRSMAAEFIRINLCRVKVAATDIPPIDNDTSGLSVPVQASAGPVGGTA